ncbi:MAG: DJ-1/PfpI family protein [Ruminococcaceae bacterium]|nr:DJ-1/PfpI family protein [Oscillospiraceae bacterium]
MIYVFLADGFEEAEALVTVDILRRAGYKVTCVGVDKKEIVGAHGIKITADIKTGEYSGVDLEGVVLPGGMPGTRNLMANATVCNAAKTAFKTGKLVCAICAAPAVLGRLGLLKGKAATCYPGFEDDLIGARYVNAPSVTDGNIVTAKGAGAVFDFGFAIVDALEGYVGASDELRESMQCTR